jgi:hypothetical protein
MVKRNEYVTVDEKINKEQSVRRERQSAYETGHHTKEAEQRIFTSSKENIK